METRRLRTLCLAAAEAAAALLLHDVRARRRPSVRGTVPANADAVGAPAVDAWSAHDVKLAIDRRCEETILHRLRRAVPRPGFIGEENGVLEGDGEITWIVDPLDGSVNYLHGLPFFAVSVACARGGARRIADGEHLPELLAGAILLPALGMRFAAELGGGATLNGRPLLLPRRGPLDRSLVSVAMSVRATGLALPAAVVERVAAHTQKLRALGATAAELALVAAGCLDGIVHRGTHLWDLAAGTLIALEAGAVVDARPAGGGRWDLLAANPDIFHSLSQVVDGP